MSRSMGSHQSARMLTDRWLTPPHIYKPLGDFDLDPCGAPGHNIARVTYTPEGGQDGLSLPWEGRVWLNPPYSRDAVLWLRRMADHGKGTALVFARTETSWFVETVWQRATAVKFLHGRLHFLHEDGTRAKANCGAPSVLVAYGSADARILRDSPIGGTYLAISNANDEVRR